MPRDTGGNYTLPAGNPVASGTVISTTWANPTMEDIAAEVTNSLDRNGRGGMLVPFRNVDGTVIAPGITFTNEPSSGLWRAGNGDVRMAIGSDDTSRWIDASGSPVGEQNPFQIWNGTSFQNALTNAYTGDVTFNGTLGLGSGVPDSSFQLVSAFPTTSFLKVNATGTSGVNAVGIHLNNEGSFAGSMQWNEDTGLFSIRGASNNVSIGIDITDNITIPGDVLVASGTLNISGANAFLALKANDTTQNSLTFGNSAGAAHWQFYEVVGAAGAQGTMAVFNNIVGDNQMVFNTAGSVGLPLGDLTLNVGSKVIFDQDAAADTYIHAVVNDTLDLVSGNITGLRAVNGQVSIPNGNLTVANLAGVGTRAVVVDANGVMSAP